MPQSSWTDSSVDDHPDVAADLTLRATCTADIPDEITDLLEQRGQLLSVGLDDPIISAAYRRLSLRVIELRSSLSRVV